MAISPSVCARSRMIDVTRPSRTASAVWFGLSTSLFDFLICVSFFGGMLTLGILAPFASRWVNRYVFNHLRYGDRGFATDPKP